LGFLRGLHAQQVRFKYIGHEYNDDLVNFTSHSGVFMVKAGMINLKAMRKRAGKKQQTIAESFNVCARTVASWEADPHSMKLGAYIKYCSLCGEPAKTATIKLDKIRTFMEEVLT